MTPRRRLLAAGLLAASLVVASACSRDEAPDRPGGAALEPGPEGPPDVVLVVLDTLRADHLSCYGYERTTSPHIDALCAESTVYENAWSASSWTLPAHASLFTGQMPIRHGAHNEHRVLDDGAATLAETLGRAGFETEAIVANAMLSRDRGLDRGFRHYREAWRKAYDDHPKLFPDFDFDRALPWEGVEDPIFRAAMLKLRPGVDENAYFRFRESVRAGGEAPLFLFVNLVGIHSPYNSAGPFYDRFLRHPELGLEENRWPEHYAGRMHFDDAQIEHFVDLYDAEILHADAIVQRMIEDLRAAGRWTNTLFIVTSDHGEHFGEHGHLSHVFSLYEALTRVPLIVHYPPRFPEGRRIRTPVHLVDLYPTILEAVGIDPSGRELDGRVLPRRDEPGSERLLVAEYYYPWEDLRFLDRLFGADLPDVERFRRRLRAIQDGRMKLIWSSDGRHELYDLAADPQERFDLFDDPAHAAERDALLAALREFVARHGGPRPLPRWDADGGPDAPGSDEGLDPETVRQLEELGYL